MPIRRRALQVPWAIASLSVVGWTLAGLIWGVFWPLFTGTFEPAHALRMVFGINIVAGSAATVFVFFAVEHQWRRQLPQFFPDGGVTEVRGVPRLPVRVRLLVVSLLLSVIPVAVLGVLAWNRARAALEAGPPAADAIVSNMLVSVVFLAVVAIVVSIVISLYVSAAWPSRSGTGHRDGRGRAGISGSLRGGVQRRDRAVTEGFNSMVQGLKEREFLRETFGKYVSQEIRDEILAGRVALEGQLREATILFADLRDFTPWVEASDPREVVRDLNAYFTEMETAIRNHGGLVLQYIGDEIEAVFGAPVNQPRHPEHAVRAAQEMRARLAAWNATRQRGRPPLRNGIGVHTGVVLAGIGSADRLSYALVGDPVNVASRIQGLTKELATDVLVSGTTRARLNGELRLTALPSVRGRDGPRRSRSTRSARSGSPAGRGCWRRPAPAAWW
jgi:adenylate cyclase